MTTGSDREGKAAEGLSLIMLQFLNGRKESPFEKFLAVMGLLPAFARRAGIVGEEFNAVVALAIAAHKEYLKNHGDFP